ncbi:retropepsin-like aspartic protease family protein [Piscinibacter koreensis]|uniref:TIGR02281 family clan AA aspartic protease n=1 Tax=Piscinibacter koreensis TaxID=2742824 RepID=A0A7Y6NPW8_9BURK|nr:TIGR02281 family clan AA aspartic protease [Schlegelella koreensis]NUZ07183.1 TIGR02281 family clan AA aspartic protease [Schlegelella koreensis]
MPDHTRGAVAAALATLALCVGNAGAQTVSLSGSLGSKALLMIDGKPRSIAVGSTVDGVRLVSVSGSEAIVEVKGQRITLALGAAQVNAGGQPSPGSGSQIVLSADINGHFFTAGTINGRAVRFVVDTGATSITIGQVEADRLGIDYRSGRRTYTNTANGVVPAYGVSLGVVQVGDVQVYNVDAIVLPAAISHVLLGNSFLTRFQMRRDNDRLTLERRF